MTHSLILPLLALVLLGGAAYLFAVWQLVLRSRGALSTRARRRRA